MSAAEETQQDEFQTIRGKRPTAWKVLIFGVPGIGKSSLANEAPGVFFLDLENGLERIDCWRTPTRLSTYEEIIKWLTWAVNNPEVKTIAIDTVDELEKILTKRVLDAYNDGKSPANQAVVVSDIPYGRGGDLLVAEWKKFIDVIERIHAKGKNTLLIGHEQVVKFENPSDANFDYFTVNLHKKATPLVIAKLDGVFYVKFESIVKGAIDNKGRELPKGKAVGTGQRVVMTTQGASWTAKNRFGLESKIPMDASLFELLK